jgi:hypothetical protein
MISTKTNNVLEEAIKSWEKEIIILADTVEWMINGEIFINDINVKKQLIEDAKMIIREISV